MLRNAAFERPYGTQTTSTILLPSDESLGYLQTSLWDEQPPPTCLGNETLRPFTGVPAVGGIRPVLQHGFARASLGRVATADGSRGF